MTAKEAKKLSEKSSWGKTQAEYVGIKILIRKAADNGRFHILIDFIPSVHNKEKLEKEGYKIHASLFHRNETTVKISWE